jgi:hypothetical protein
MNIRVFLLILFAVSACAPQLRSQAIPATASANLYFPHFVVGGNPADYWVTSFDFANPYDRPVRVWLYGNAGNGESMPLSLGGNTSTEHVFDIPGNGSFTLESPSAAQDLRIGWVVAYAAMPVQGIATYTRYRNGAAYAKVTAEAAPQTVEYLNIANRNVGLALANRNEFSITLDVDAVDEHGNFAGHHSVTLPAWGHTAFNLYGPMPNLPQNFRGTVRVSTPAGKTYFLAWALTDDGSGVSSALPAGHYRRPVSQRDRIENVFFSLSAAFDEQVGGTMPELSIIDDTSMGPNAFARERGGQVEEIGITLALAELLADSADELAAVIGHEMGHVAQYREGGTLWEMNPERDADVRGTILALGAGYDPYALAGALAKLEMASGTASLMTQWESFSSGEIHGSFNDRLATVYDTLSYICDSSTVGPYCAQYRDVFHPHLPLAPLNRGAKLSAPRAALAPIRPATKKQTPLQVDRSRKRSAGRVQ